MNEDPSPTEAAGAKQPAARERRHALRFVWQIDPDGRFTLGTTDFAEAMGAPTLVRIGRPWNEITAELGLDPDRCVERAIASRDTWNGITLAWPVEGSEQRLAVELSGLPAFDRDRSFRGYRGFGVCRDVARINDLMRLRRAASRGGAPPPSRPEPPVFRDERPTLTIVPPSENVVPFRSSA